jgi:predicted Zn-dependent protease
MGGFDLGRHADRTRGRVRWPIIILFVVGAAIYWLSNQQPVPFTGRNQFVTVPVEDEIQLGLSSYQQVLSESQVVRGSPEASLVESIGARLARAAMQLEDEYAAQGMTFTPLARRFDWRFHLIASDQVNAFCLPGGYVAIYTGILPVARNADGLAAIMGHEIAHALARHGAERMSQQQIAQFGQMAVGLAAGDLDPGAARQVLTIYGLAAQGGVLLPFSRKHEEEADKIGLELLTRACFDPREAPLLWERMAALGGGAAQRPPELLSTHPDPARRAENLRAWMPEAVVRFERTCGPLPARADS